MVQVKRTNVLLLLNGLFISFFNCLYEKDQELHIQPKLSGVCDIKTCQIGAYVTVLVTVWNKVEINFRLFRVSARFQLFALMLISLK